MDGFHDNGFACNVYLIGQQDGRTTGGRRDLMNPGVGVHLIDEIPDEVTFAGPTWTTNEDIVSPLEFAQGELLFSR